MRSIAIPFLVLTLVGHTQSWVQLAELPGTPRDDAASFHCLDKIFVGTGMDVGFQLTNDWYAYSLDTQNWETVASLPASGRQYCSGFSMGDQRGHLFGGLDASGALNELWRYDPLADSWTQRSPLPAPGRYASAVIVSGDHAYICGGMLADGTPTNEVWRYDLASDTWTARSPMPGPPRHRAVALGNMVVGGADSAFQALSDVYTYIAVTDEWVQQPDLPEPRFGASSAEHMLLCGASSLDQNHNTVFVLDPISGAWAGTSIPPFPGGPRKGAVGSGQSYIADVGIFFHGLGIDGPTRYNDWWRLDLPVGLEEHTTHTFTVHPNPADQYFMAGLPSEERWTTCTLLDGLGRVVLEQRNAAGNMIRTAHLPQGRYVVRLASGGQLVHAPLVILR